MFDVKIALRQIKNCIESGDRESALSMMKDAQVECKRNGMITVVARLQKDIDFIRETIVVGDGVKI